MEDRGYGTWLNQLYKIVKTGDVCQPEQAREPSATKVVSTDQPDLLEMPENEGSFIGKNSKLFVPVKQPKQKSRDETVCKDIKLLRRVVKNDPTRELISFTKAQFKVVPNYVIT